MNRLIICGILCLLIFCLSLWSLFGIVAEDNDGREEKFLTEKLLHGIGVRYWLVDIPHAPAKISFYYEDFDSGDKQKLFTVNISTKRNIIGLQQQQSDFILFICDDSGNTTAYKIDRAVIKMPLLTFNSKRNLECESYLLKGSSTSVNINFSTLFKGENGIRLSFEK